MPIKRLEYRRLAQWVLVVAGLGFMLLWRLDHVPLLWWDEGWTLTVARNWVERGFYGRLLNGELTPPGLEAAFVFTAPVALSMRLLGMGAWQGRLPDVLFTAGALLFTWRLADRLYNRAIANGTLFVLAFLANNPSVNALLNGRQVLADIPAVFFLLLGCEALLRAWRRSAVWLIVVALAWGLALDAKAQTLPFWLFALTVPLLLALLARRWRDAAWTTAVLAGSWIVSRLVLQAQVLILSGHTAPVVAIPGLNEAVIFVTTPIARSVALIVVLTTGLPALLGLAWAIWRAFKERQALVAGDPLATLRLILLLLSGSWFGWYLLLSNGGPRYLASPNALAAIFVAAMLYAATDHYNIPETVRRVTDAMKLRQISRANLSALGIALLVTAMVASTITVYYLLFRRVEDDVALTANYLNAYAAPSSLVEMYDAELFFLFQGRYHYPPDPLHVEFIRRMTHPTDAPIDYDPLAADPDYLVVGPVSFGWHVYDTVVQTGAFRLVLEQGNYQVYQRIR